MAQGQQQGLGHRTQDRSGWGARFRLPRGAHLTPMTPEEEGTSFRLGLSRITCLPCASAASTCTAGGAKPSARLCLPWWGVCCPPLPHPPSQAAGPSRQPACMPFPPEGGHEPSNPLSAGQPAAGSRCQCRHSWLLGIRQQGKPSPRRERCWRPPLAGCRQRMLVCGAGCPR